MTLKEAYARLRVSSEASLAEVKSAFRRMAFELHPDLHPDNPNAQAEFQRVNEAYVIIKDHLERPRSDAERRADDRARQRAKTQAKQRAKEQGRDQSEARKRAEQQFEQARANKEFGRERTVNREEVLHTILKDPFARQVFEDIYRQVKQETGSPGASPGEAMGGAQASQSSRSTGASSQSRPPKPPKPPKQPKSSKKQKKVELEWGKSKHSVDVSEGVYGALKGWAKGLMDETQVVHLPAANLRPGARLRLNIHRGLSDKATVVEVTLPPDFVVGKPLRLRGLGRRIAGLKGDLYLKILAG